MDRISIESKIFNKINIEEKVKEFTIRKNRKITLSLICFNKIMLIKTLLM